jgi:tetratricopeptide (TPR) repeat protein
MLLPFSVASSRENSSELYQKGAQLAVSGDLDGAIRAFKKVIDLSPRYCMGHYGLGKAYLYKHGMLGEAIIHLKASVQLDRKFVKGYFYLGMGYLLAKKYPYAAQAFKTAYSLDNGYVEALYNLGVVFDIMEKTYESQVYFTRFFDKRAKKEEDIIF